MMSSYNLLGVKIQTVPSHLIKEILRSFLKSDQQHQIATVNPEFIVAAQKNKTFANIINETSLATIDGTGIIQALQFLGQPVSLDDRLTGAFLLEKILEIATLDQYKVMFCLYTKSLTKPEKLAASLRQKFPDLDYQISDENTCLTQSNVYLPDILIMTLGAPKQELWINENLAKLPTIKLAVGIGGAIDFLSGAIKRAPKVFRSFGLEWLWRFLRQPRRFPRIWRAIFVFYFLVLKYKLEHRNDPEKKVAH